MVYILVFVTLVIVTMMVGAAFTLLPTQLNTGLRDQDSVQVLAAVSAGADYAQSQLQNRPNWKGDRDGTGTMAGFTINSPALQVYEDKGNVVGLLTSPDGSKQAFRFRFNFQNGSSNSPEDGFAQNPASTHLMRFPLVSNNNLGSFAASNLYTGDSTGQVSGSPTGQVGRFQSAIFIQGLAGPGLRNATVDTLDAFPGRRGVLSRTVCTRLGFLNQSRVDSAAYAGGGIHTNAANNATLTSAPGVAVANIRALDTITTATGTELVATDTLSRAFYSNDTSTPSSGVKVTAQAQSKAAQESHWLKMKWSQVPKAPTNAPTRLKAGTYVWQRDSVTGNPQLAYYPEDYSGSGTFTPTTTPTLVSTAADMMTSIGTGVSLDLPTMTTTITESVYVDAVGGANGLAVLIDPTFQAALPTRPNVILDPDPAKTSMLSAAGSLFVQGKIEGVGSITTEGDLKIQGTSLFEADPGDAVVLYSKQNISVESIPPSVAAAVAPNNTYRPGMGNGRARGWRNRGQQPADPATILDGDVSFAGAVFAMGNFTTNIDNGNLYIRGVLSAYGGDPESQAPGSVAGSGTIDITSPGSVEFMYDPSYLMNKSNTGETPSYLDRISWNFFGN